LKQFAKNRDDVRTLWEHCIARVHGETDKVTSALVEEIWVQLLANGSVNGKAGPKEAVISEPVESFDMIDPETLAKLESFTSGHDTGPIDGLMLLAESISKMTSSSDYEPVLDESTNAPETTSLAPSEQMQDLDYTPLSPQLTTEFIDTRSVEIDSSAKELEDAIKNAAVKGYRLQPCIAGRWINEHIEAWRVVHEPSLAEVMLESVNTQLKMKPTGLAAIRTLKASSSRSFNDCDALVTPVSPYPALLSDKLAL
jgi:hypothetical protein